jgi:carotenoid cleavage dioxygenase-like enzyme
MLHRFALQDGGVTYANRFLESKAFRAAEETGKISYAEFATDPCRTLFGRVAAIFDPKLTDNCCVNVSDYARDAVAFTETSIPMRFSRETLETLGVFNYRRALKGQVSTAHPHYDATRGCHDNYIAHFGMKSLYRLCRIGDDGEQRVVAKLPVERPAYMHSFGMSQDHLVLTEFPLVVNRSILGSQASPLSKTRFHIPFASDAPVTRRILADVPLELPRINYESCAGKPYRYVWGTGVQTKGDFLDSLVKIDTKTGTVATWHAAGLYPGEPAFVPSPSAEAEDDGVLLSIVLDIGKDRSFLLVLDAASLKELARAEAPHAIPFHFHGNYFPNGLEPA